MSMAREGVGTRGAHYIIFAKRVTIPAVSLNPGGQKKSDSAHCKKIRYIRQIGLQTLKDPLKIKSRDALAQCSILDWAWTPHCSALPGAQGACALCSAMGSRLVPALLGAFLLIYARLCCCEGPTTTTLLVRELTDDGKLLPTCSRAQRAPCARKSVHSWPLPYPVCCRGCLESNQQAAPTRGQHEQSVQVCQ